MWGVSLPPTPATAGVTAKANSPKTATTLASAFTDQTVFEHFELISRSSCRRLDNRSTRGKGKAEPAGFPHKCVKSVSGRVGVTRNCFAFCSLLRVGPQLLNRAHLRSRRQY